MSNEEKIPTGIYYVIPAQVFEDDRLEHSETVFYGLLSGLSFSSGFCFASNEYLAKRMRVDERTIRKWLERLEDFGYVKREIKKEGFKWDRKIFITHAVVNSNNSYERTYKAGSRGLPGPDQADFQGHIVSKALESKEELVCIRDEDKASQIIKKKHPDGHFQEISLQDIFKRAVLERKSWSTEEIYDCWKILSEYEGYVRDPMAFFEGTIKNLQTKKRSNFINGGKKCQKQTKQTKNESETPNASTLGNDTKERRSLASLALEMEQMKKSCSG